MRKGLGRGLSALLGEESAAPGGSAAAAAAPPAAGREVPIEQLRPNPYQPRRHFDEQQLEELAQSIRDRGVLQPILVRPAGDGTGGYEIIAGERRWRAAQRAQVHQVPVVVRALSDRDALEVALIENLQRHDLTAIEEAQGYRRLQGEFGYGQEELGRAVGKSRSHVANLMRLLSLPEAVQRLVEDGTLTMGHARALLAAADPLAAAHQVVARGLNVRQTEALSAGRRRGGGARRNGQGGGAKDADTRALERSLAAALGLPVQIDHAGERGEVRIRYRSLEQLDEVCRRLHAGPAAAPGEDPL